MDYYYKGILRLNGIWGTPTACGMYMALGALLCVFLSVRCWPRREERWAAVGLLGAALVFEWLLVATYSRASYLAFLVALAPLAGLRPRWLPAAAAGLFLVLCVAAPSGSSRLASTTDSDDPAVRQRLLLWESTAELILDNWPTGVHRDGYLAVHRAWYLPEGMEQVKYNRPVNAYLNLGAEYGVGLLTVAVLLSSYSVVWLTLLARRSGRHGVALAAGVLIIYVISNIFSIRTVDLFWTTAVVVTMGFAVASGWRTTGEARKDWRAGAIFSGVATLLIVALILGVGFLSKNRRNYAMNRVEMVTEEGPVRGAELVPRKPALFPPVIVVAAGESPAGQMLATTWARRGVEVVYLETGRLGPAPTIQAIRTQAAQARQKGRPAPIVMGVGQGAAPAFFAVCGQPGWSGLVTVDLTPTHPLASASPVAHVGELGAPLLSVRTSTRKKDGLQQLGELVAPPRSGLSGLEVADIDYGTVSGLVTQVAEWASRLEGQTVAAR